ncbi:unnamed protein product [Dicrocoelium dendriticum]|nr:unnamed protein product [Dicrocoelium dendriticum]
MSAKRAILLLRKMVIEHEKVHMDKSSSHRNLARHLDFLASISADNSSHWSDYCEKLRTYSVNFCKRLLVATSQQVHTSPASLVNSDHDEPSCLPCDRPCFSHLQRSVFDELSNMYPDAQLSRCQPNALWKRAFEVSGVMDVVHTVSSGCSKSLASKQSTNECEIIDATMRTFIVQLKGHLAELRCLFDLCTNPGGDIQSEDKRPVLKRKRSSDLSSPSKPARLKRRPCLGVDMDSSEEITTVFDTPKTRAASAHCRFSDSTISAGRPTRATQKSLVPKEYFTKFVGTVATPPPSPAPATQMKEVFRLDSVPPGQKRVPWSVEESIALWHGVTTHKGNRWADIWHQSFKRSGRSQVDLKDRWRVIQRNHTIRDAIARAYEAWVCDQKNHLDRLPCGALPTPVIVRSPAL